MQKFLIALIIIFFFFTIESVGQITTIPTSRLPSAVILETEAQTINQVWTFSAATIDFDDDLAIRWAAGNGPSIQANISDNLTFGGVLNDVLFDVGSNGDFTIFLDEPATEFTLTSHNDTGNILLKNSGSGSLPTADIVLDAADDIHLYDETTVGGNTSPPSGHSLYVVGGDFGMNSPTYDIQSGSVHDFHFSLPGTLPTTSAGNVLGSELIVPFDCTLVKARLHVRSTDNAGSLQIDIEETTNSNSSVMGSPAYIEVVNTAKTAEKSLSYALTAGDRLVVDVDGNTLAAVDASIVLIAVKTGDY